MMGRIYSFRTNLFLHTRPDIVSDTSSFTFAVDIDGRLSAGQFKPRNLGKVVQSLLGEDWKKSPKKLLKSMTRLPDVYAAVFEARRRMIPQHIARYETLHEKVRKLSALGLRSMELNADGLPSEDNFDDAHTNDIFETYAETRREALRCHRALSLMQKAALSDWVKCMDKPEFKTLVAMLSEQLERRIAPTDSLFCPLQDTARGAARRVLMGASPADMKNFGCSFEEVDGTSCAIIVNRNAFNAWCGEHGFGLVEMPTDALARSQATQEAAKAKSKKTRKAGKTAETGKSAQKGSTQPLNAAKLESTVGMPLAVRVIKTEARLSTARPKAAPCTPAPAADSGSSSDSDILALADRLVSGLQIEPSRIEHRAPGRPRKRPAPETPCGQAPAAPRPASRNRSGGR